LHPKFRDLREIIKKKQTAFKTITMLKNDLFLRALKGETVERPPVWMMRQAGRYLPEFRALRDKYDFFTRCETPELAAEITVQPIRIVKPDAAILFSDILVVPRAMGIHVELKDNIGPIIPNPIRSMEQVNQVFIPDVNESLGYVMDAIKLTKEMLNNEVPLIGFAGSPWTTDTTILYLKEKVKNGCNAIQIFDSWGGMLSQVDYQEFSWKYINQIVEAIAPLTEVIVFGKGCWFALNEMSKSKASALGVDWTCSPRNARYLTGGDITLQGNFDPSRLLSPIPTIKKMVHEMIEEFGKDKYIVNLGHGILPNIPVDHAKAFVEAVKEYQK
jgi:uroporphyrinogen decarboxylase